MNLDSIALWLGYGSMIVGGILLVLSALICAAVALGSLIGVTAKNLRNGWDLRTLRKTMRQLEAEGKVSKRSEVNHG